MIRIVLGGTFESLHAGHSELILEAFRLLQDAGDGIVHIGLTSDEMASAKNHSVLDYASRKVKLEEFISELLTKMSLPDECYFISELKDPFGPAVTGNYDYIIVSPETVAGAKKINELRCAAHLPELKIHQIDFVLAEDQIPISTTRIYEGEIDRYGRLQKSNKNKLVKLKKK